MRRFLSWLAFALATIGMAALLSPWLYAELFPWLNRYQIVAGKTPSLARGEMVDDYFVVEPIGDATFAIGEPRYYQANYTYLILGRKRALLFDAGSGTRDIEPVARSLTRLPITVVVSHLHYDHVGGVAGFDGLAMINLPSTRALAKGDRLTPGRYHFLGHFDGIPEPTIVVTDWLDPGHVIDLGGRWVQLVATPGHTPDGVSIWDASSRRFFSGDFIYPSTLYAFLPGANLSQYRMTARRLLAQLPADTVLWGAHCCRKGEDFGAPWLAIKDLGALEKALGAIEGGNAKGAGWWPRRYPVNDQMTLAARPF